MRRKAQDLGKSSQPESIYCGGREENKPFLPSSPRGGRKQNIPSSVIQNFPAAKPVSPPESCKSLRLSPNILQAQSSRWRVGGPGGSRVWSFICLFFTVVTSIGERQALGWKRATTWWHTCPHNTVCSSKQPTTQPEGQPCPLALGDTAPLKWKCFKPQPLGP